MKLVEVVVARETSDDTKEHALAFVRQIGKLPVVVRDSPGFLVNRVLFPYLIDAAELFEAGVELEKIDQSDVHGLMRLDQRIHRQVYQATRNAFLQSMLEESFNLSLRIWFLGLDRGIRLKEAVGEHRRLLDAIVSRDADQAEAIMRQHVTGFEQAIRKVL